MQDYARAQTFLPEDPEDPSIWLDVITLDSWGLTVIKLARQRGIECNLNVIELPQSLLDDVRIDTSGLVLPAADKINAVLQEINK
ncbi:MAG: hypothetical protein K2K63_13210 [Acetatifactor sp.]|nr:hypothetical protein [Acetatifactor sp.]